jgi:hypothetical protein
MMVLGTVLGGLSNHLRKVQSRATEMKSESTMMLIVPNPLLSRNLVFDEALNEGTVVGSEPLLNSPLELMIDEVGYIPLTIRMGLVHEIDVVAMTSSRISNLAHNSSMVNASQGAVEVVHASDVWRRWLDGHIRDWIAEK